MDGFLPNDFEDEEKIEYQYESVSFVLSNQTILSAWLQQVINKENKRLRRLNFIFCSDPYLHKINVEYLHHDTLTDVITFPYAAPPEIEGDIFISIERVRENAGIFNHPFDEELHRVMAHGLLHLCGYGDKTKEEKEKMIAAENSSLETLKTFLAKQK